MQKLAKKLSVLMTVVMVLSLMFSFTMTAGAATVYPQVQYAQEPQMEYTVGDRVSFNLYTPNYGGRVQYRVVLWNDETKSYKDLWNTPDRYYDKWMPYGNEMFTLGWIINDPGHYRITIYAKRAGITNNECYLKGFNCDSYMESDSFVVKAKPVAETPKAPDIAADSLKLDVKSAQMVVGQEYTVKANVGKAGVRVIFDIDAPSSSMNKDMTGEAVSDASGIATYKYTRTYGDADYISAYPAASPAVRDVAKVYWGVKPILTIEALDKDDAASITNGGIKQYKVTLRNPMNGEPMRYKEVKVMLKENIDTAELRSTAVVTNDFNGVRVTPYQRTNNIIPGGLNEVTLSLVTNDNGEATFTMSGYNTKATPVVYIDSYDFFNTLPIFQLGYVDSYNRSVSFDINTNSWIWSAQVPGRVQLPDTSQVGPTFAGDYDCRLDATEMQAEAKTVSFVLIGYTFESTMNGDKYVAVDPNYASGRKYTVTVKKPDGTPFAGGRLMVRVEQLFDNVSLSNHTDARLFTVKPDGSINGGLGNVNRTLELTLNSSGKASFYLASPTLNDIATPRVWIDQDTPNYPLNGGRNGIFQEGEPTKVLDTIYFVNQAINSASFAATLPSYLKVTKDADGNVRNLAGLITTFTYTIKDQNGNVWIPPVNSGLLQTNVLVTYNLTNNGSHTINVIKPQLADVKVSQGLLGYTGFIGNELPLAPGDSISISGIDNDATSVISAYTNVGDDSALTITVNAVATRSSDSTFPWSQPSNTTSAMLGNATLKTSWIAFEDYTAYPGTTVAADGKIVATYKPIDANGNYVPGAYAVMELSNEAGTFVKVPLVANGNGNTVEYKVAYNASYPIYSEVYKDVFEAQMTNGDILFFRLTLANNFQYILVNTDNSLE